MWVWKPANAARGEGVAVITRAEAEARLRAEGMPLSIAANAAAAAATRGPRLPRAVLQRYVRDPLTIGGLKFDLRCYAAVLRDARGTLTAYVFRDGLARFATLPYDTAGTRDDDDERARRRHLTNYSVQADGHGAAFVESDDASGAGGLDARGRVRAHKWSAASAIAHVAAARGATGSSARAGESATWARIGEAVRGVVEIAAAADESDDGAAGRSGGGGGDDGNAAFELVGVDVILDASGRVWLLELQREPSLAPTSALDARIKSALVRDTEALLRAAADGAPGRELPSTWRRARRATATRAPNSAAARRSTDDELARRAALDAVSVGIERSIALEAFEGVWMRADLENE